MPIPVSQPDVSPFFSDPDGDDLTYAAESSDATAVTVSIEGIGLTVTAAAVGTATVTVTASDPDGLTAMQSVEVTVAAGFRDDFDTAASLDDWELRRASARVVDGVLHLTGTEDKFLGILRRWIRPPLTEWTIRARLGRAADEGFAEVYWLTGDDAFAVLGISLGPDDENNYTLWWFKPGGRRGDQAVVFGLPRDRLLECRSGRAG